jgi:hypothetical protein
MVMARRPDEGVRLHHARPRGERVGTKANMPDRHGRLVPIRPY